MKIPIMLALALASPLLGAGPLGGDFTLTDASGSVWSTEGNRGKVLVLTFGYTYCPDVCPTTLATIAAAMKAIGADADQVQPVFISLDPDRDTPRKLAEYTHWFYPTMVGVTGSSAELAEMAGRYQVSYRFVGKGETERYTLDHSSNTYVLDRHGHLASVVPYGLPPTVTENAIRGALRIGAEAPEDPRQAAAGGQSAQP
jgi:protein SCO1